MRRKINPEDPSLLTSLNNLGHLYHLQGAPGKARGELQDALALAKATLGEEHPLTLEILQNLAYICLDERAVERSRELADRVYRFRKTRLKEILEQGGERRKIRFREKTDFLSLWCALGDAKRIAECVVPDQRGRAGVGFRRTRRPSKAVSERSGGDHGCPRITGGLQRVPGADPFVRTACLVNGSRTLGSLGTLEGDKRRP